MLFFTIDHSSIYFLIKHTIFVVDCCILSCNILFPPIQITHMVANKSCFCLPLLLSINACSKVFVPFLHLGHSTELLILLLYRFLNVGI
ncbi:hypothetical protein Gorai_024128 [Gossypium raimondii]|uniref:Uncharacterized protein n=1 Tax=Gossypium raimondii TaxID=29730 RepID=A0A7J8NZ05_GOSRA|nr:hypothetical protein [Gossypium raimondii]